MTRRQLFITVGAAFAPPPKLTLGDFLRRLTRHRAESLLLALEEAVGAAQTRTRTIEMTVTVTDFSAIENVVIEGEVRV